MAICPDCKQEHWAMSSKTERVGDAYVTTFWTVPPCKPIIRLFAQGYMERVLGWVRPAEHFVELRAGWDCAEQDIAQAATNTLKADDGSGSALSVARHCWRGSSRLPFGNGPQGSGRRERKRTGAEVNG